MVEKSVRELVIAHEQAFQPEKAAGISVVVQYHLTGLEGGEWVISIRDGACKVRQGLAENPRITMTADAAVFRDLLLRRTDATAAYMQGKIAISGDLMLAMKLIGLFKFE